MFEVRGGGQAFIEWTASNATDRARVLRQQGINDVEIFRANGIRISLYSLGQEVQAGVRPKPDKRSSGQSSAAQ